VTDSLPVVSLPAGATGALARESRGALSSEMDFGPSGMVIKSVEQGMALAKYLVDGGAAPKGWTPAQVFLAMQAGLEHGLGHTGGLQSFVVINSMPSWKGQAAVGKIRASKVLVPGSLKFGCEDDPDAPAQKRGWCEGQRIGDPTPTRRVFTQRDAVKAGLWSAGNNWSKFPERMLMWRAVGFLTKDLFADVLGNFPIAEEMEGHEEPRRAARVSILATTPSERPAPDPILAEIAGSTEPVTPEVVAPESALETDLRKSVEGLAAVDSVIGPLAEDPLFQRLASKGKK